MCKCVAAGRDELMVAATRVETDSMGPVEVPAEALWGAQTQRSLQNFDIAADRMPTELIHALARIKQVAAIVNTKLGVLDEAKRDLIVDAAAGAVSASAPSPCHGAPAPWPAAP